MNKVKMFGNIMQIARLALKKIVKEAKPEVKSFEETMMTASARGSEDSEGEEKNAAPNRHQERGKCGPTELKVLTLGRNTSFGQNSIWPLVAGLVSRLAFKGLSYRMNCINYVHL